MRVLLLVGLLLAVVCFKQTSAYLLSSSKVIKCLDRGTGTAGGTEEKLSCSEKFVVTVSLQTKANQTERIEASISTVSDENGLERTLQSRLTIKLMKHEALLVFPITYLQEVNYKPYEAVKLQGVLTPCNDGELASVQASTCGFYTDQRTGEKIPDSQGFCCACSLGQTLGLSDAKMRFNSQNNCDISRVFSYGTSGHCLRFAKEWWDAYQIGLSQISYRISLSVLLDGVETSVIELSPEEPVAHSEKLLGRVVGDFAPFKTFPNFANKKLFVPQSSPDRLQNAMLIDDVDVDLTGATCDKVGVSFAAFRYQYKGCERQVGDCLHRQLKDLHEQDSERIQQNKATKNLLQSFGNVKVGDTSPLYNTLQFYIEQAVSTVVTIEFVADSISWVENVGTGAIISALIAPFESQSADGELEVVVKNTGSINSDYTIEVTDCSPGITPILAVTTSIGAGEKLPIRFDIFSESGVDAQQQCTVGLRNSQAEIIDSQVVKFNTTATVVDGGAQAGDLYSSASAEVSIGGGDASTECACSSFFDLFCLLTNPACIPSLLKIAGVGLGIILLPLGIFVSARYCIARKICCCAARRAIGRVIAPPLPPVPPICSQIEGPCFFNHPSGLSVAGQIDSDGTFIPDHDRGSPVSFSQAQQASFITREAKFH